MKNTGKNLGSFTIVKLQAISRRLIAIIALVAVIGFSMAACGGDDDDGGPVVVVGNEYQVQWGTTNISYSDIANTISNQSWTIEETDDTSWALATGTTATAIYNYCMNPINNISWTNAGTYGGSFDVCVNASIYGVSAPSGLKTAANSNKNDVPLAGVYYDASAGVVLLYLTKN